jgi:hypothetical protein
MERPIAKTFVYIDGYNLYHGMMDGTYIIPNDDSKPALRKYLWLNLPSFIASYLARSYRIEQLHYFTAPVLNNPDSIIRQKKYWKALESYPNVKIHLGKHLPYRNSYSEKQSDVRMALQMYQDARDNQPNCMVILSADSDQVPTLETIIRLNRNIEFRAVFPPCRGSDDIRALIPLCHKTDYKRLRSHQFPDQVEYERDGQLISVQRPIEWA